LSSRIVVLVGLKVSWLRWVCHGCRVHLDVLHVLPSNQRRGAETFAFDLHHTLADRGVRSAIWCLEPGRGDRSLPVPALADRRFSLAGVRALRREAVRAGLVVAHGSSTLLACSLGLVGLGVPFVYLNIGDPRYWAKSPTRRLRARWLIGRAAAVTAISPRARDVLVGYYRLDAAHVHVIPNGRAADRFVPAGAALRTASRRALGVSTAGDVVAVVGALTAEKRVDVAIKAIARSPDVVLVVAGDGPKRPTLEALAEQAAPGRVVFLGTTDGSSTVLAAADVLALSSDSEGVPGVLIEAGLAGLPVVATDVGWVRDVVRPGTTGLLVPPGRPDLFGTALREALDRRGNLGRAGRAHCLAEFEMGPVVDKWQRLIERTTSRRRNGSVA
jgi:glycosyltransferase involved in cell wall biosynthesis